MNPAVCVLMPVYNTERYVAEAVESILAQTFTDFEFLIIDDGSTDRSLAILQGFAARDPRIRLISRPNIGFTPTLVEGFGLTRCEFVARMDPDDVALPRLLETELDYLRQHPECVAVGCRLLLVDPDGDLLCPWTNIEHHEEIDAAHLKGHGGAIANASTTFRREAVLAVGGYRPAFEYAEDLDLFLRLAEYGRLVNVSEPLYKYRRHPSAVGYANRQRQIAAATRSIREARQRRGLPDTEVIEGFSDPVAAGAPENVHLTWAWWALQAAQVKTARKHAMKALSSHPFDLESWRVAYCAWRGR